MNENENENEKEYAIIDENRISNPTPKGKAPPGKIACDGLPGKKEKRFSLICLDPPASAPAKARSWKSLITHKPSHGRSRP